MAGEGTYLERILAEKRSDLARRGGAVLRAADVDARVRDLPAPRDLAAALRGRSTPGVIAEFKRASPSEGVIRENADPRAIAASYVEAGAAAVSVLTDRHFSGSLDDLRDVRRTVSVPVLCKDFILDRLQIVEAREAGADAVLLIVAALEPPTLRLLLEFATDLSLSVLCEAHDEAELDRAMAAGARIVGVNARDLKTFAVDLDRVVSLRARVPRSFIYVAESGIRGFSDYERLRLAGVDGVLVGTHFMRAQDPGQALVAMVTGGS